MALARMRLRVLGLVQGVGFRPFVYRLATDLGLAGLVGNSAEGAFIEVEGLPAPLLVFKQRLVDQAPPPCTIIHLEAMWIPARGQRNFEIAPSATADRKTALILPDLATCPECVREIRDPANRRYRYPFTNCTVCGPRYSIIEAVPYDRERTVMRRFQLCAQCRVEYESPDSRRFHAEPIACPSCGPKLAFQTIDGTLLAICDEALILAVRALREGRIVAVKGLGGYQLLVRADQDAAVERLRVRKHREAKPLALMCPSLETAGRFVRISAEERRLLLSPASPIVLLERLSAESPAVAPSVAPENPWLGIMLPTTPLHHLLLTDLDLTVVATSGNPSEEPLCTDDEDARQRLGGIADFFLLHDRPIARPVDDSVARILLGTEQILRRARGYAPLPLSLPSTPTSMASATSEVLGLGAHLKSAIAYARGDDVFLSQHVGDLESARTCVTFERTVADLGQLLEIQPGLVVADLHPDYYSSQRAASFSRTIISVPHHEAHALSCLADHRLAPPALAIVWDGTGLGPDGTLWGGDFLEITETQCLRRASFRAFPLPGGDEASRDARRSAVGALHEAGLIDTETSRRFLKRVFAPSELGLMRAAVARNINSPRTSSVGRLFDAVAALIGLPHLSRFEGEAAMRLEWTAWSERGRRGDGPLPLSCPLEIIQDPAGIRIDWRPFLEALIQDDSTRNTGSWALAWHEALADAAVRVALLVQQPRVVLSGGCFQNRLLTESTAARLQAAGFQVQWHQRVPPNDGGLAVGQIVGARRRQAAVA
ncbi:MAG: carbamoyltransferase HypF [Verrucomicrobiales bacterium]|nr:carbamoyltransferase HypF [Verrucomicrobiales bacterium]